jgi:hypothetical protein
MSQTPHRCGGGPGAEEQCAQMTPSVCSWSFIPLILIACFLLLCVCLSIYVCPDGWLCRLCSMARQLSWMHLRWVTRAASDSSSLQGQILTIRAMCVIVNIYVCVTRLPPACWPYGISAYQPSTGNGDVTTNCCFFLFFQWHWLETSPTWCNDSSLFAFAPSCCLIFRYIWNNEWYFGMCVYMHYAACKNTVSVGWIHIRHAREWTGQWRLSQTPHRCGGKFRAQKWCT